MSLTQGDRGKGISPKTVVHEWLPPDPATRRRSRGG